MKRIGFLAYGACLAGITALTAGSTVNSILFLHDYAGVFSALAIAGWLIASLCPITLSLFAWVMSGRIKARWLPHILFIPAAIAAFGVGSSLFFDTIGVLSDSMAGGFALLTGIGYLMLALLIHLVAAIVLGVIDVRRWANGS
ncbi:hypothetical protein [Sphingomonas sp. ERG5]|uniref:hypothetical protein n=1 Tax=Sphingomonas sp. ERG5 TaxID=1381597 RepID=UPI00054BB549|nr:hypothetical protein [Sphingomonas sp. ERG5]